MRRILLAGLLLLAPCALADDLLEKVEHGFADSNGVKIHYASMGEGPLIVMIHGFPDFWYSWRNQMPALAEKYHVVAIDQRGYNESDKPEGQENYTLDLLAADVVAVIKHLGEEKATVVGHDWGGMVAWWTAMYHPEAVDKLVILNLPHPKCFTRELAINPEQTKNAKYAQDFINKPIPEVLTPQALAWLVAKDDAETSAVYQAAFEKSCLECMINYYKENYPKEPYQQDPRDLPRIKVPVLQFHGLKDTALHANGLNNTWDWLDNTWTLVTVPNASHWVQHDAPEVVTNNMLDWLARN
ncbi:MAG: alpha/beta fold hydrolase [Candidatus Hydrogenedens sp.]|nr:alpha/beta fold hydrolase [Candidatus Hydrogenedens sp.]